MAFLKSRRQREQDAQRDEALAVLDKYQGIYDGAPFNREELYDRPNLRWQQYRVIYAVGKDSDKRSAARNMLVSGVVISTQVVNETINVLTRKQGATLTVAHEIAESLLVLCKVVPIRAAMRLTRRYSLSHWDALIIGAALLAGCSTLYSQDMQHGQVIDGRLTLVNPFVYTLRGHKLRLCSPSPTGRGLG